MSNTTGNYRWWCEESFKTFTFFNFNEVRKMGHFQVFNFKSLLKTCLHTDNVVRRVKHLQMCVCLCVCMSVLVGEGSAELGGRYQKTRSALEPLFDLDINQVSSANFRCTVYWPLVPCLRHLPPPPYALPHTPTLFIPLYSVCRSLQCGRGPSVGHSEGISHTSTWSFSIPVQQQSPVPRTMVIPTRFIEAHVEDMTKVLLSRCCEIL